MLKNIPEANGWISDFVHTPVDAVSNFYLIFSGFNVIPKLVPSYTCFVKSAAGCEILIVKFLLEFTSQI